MEESIAEEEEFKTIIELNQNDMHHDWLILPFLLANTDKKQWSHKHILAILTPSCMQSLITSIFYFHLVTSAPGMHPHHFYMYMEVLTPPSPPSHTPRQVLLQTLRRFSHLSLLTWSLLLYVPALGYLKMMELLGDFKLP